MPAIVNPADFIKVGVISVIFIFFMNKILRSLNLESFTV